MNNETNELGRVVCDEQALVNEAAAHLHPSGFDPSRKIVINGCHGGFGLSGGAVRMYAERKGLTLFPEASAFGSIVEPTWWLVPPEERPPPQDNWHEMSREGRIASNKAHDDAQLSHRDIARDDADLIAVVETMGNGAGGRFSDLRVVEIPADVDWCIEEYDGREWIAEKHRTWS